ncbi:hypothetical protein [Alkalicoccus luteus]|uniref:Uncharacterized protein n=1 Tax=Alkalicoccus luteus TaxID=1237094 RepID=A0A969TV19_9BACI|nr:hypothetical protein [Alkalicoccus luteus]NJP39293.1 hypothetical protein [Alkalicoccus luteus]
MKAGLLFFIVSVITLRGCGEAGPYEQAELYLDPEYAGGTLSVTPVVMYTGEHEALFHYEEHIATITRVEQGETLLYEADENTTGEMQEVTLDDETEHSGEPVEVEAEPGELTIEAEAVFTVTPMGEEAESREYKHTLRQRVDVQSGGGDAQED